jgi:hypothetical protein
LILLPGDDGAIRGRARSQDRRDQARRLSGHIRVASKRGQFLRFCIDFDAKE